jgi:hypothetical protein
MKIPLLAGRTFVRRDLDSETPTVIVVNESFAKRYFGDEPAVGRLFDARFGRTRAPNEVVGVVADVRYDLRKPPAPTIYMLGPLRSFSTLHIRVAGDSRTIAARVHAEVHAATPLLRVTSVSSQTAMVNRTVVRERLLALLAGFFALVGLALTAVGLYGTLSYAVVQRTREIGIRVALGAQRAELTRMFVRSGLVLAAVGVPLGLVAAVVLSRLMSSLLFGVSRLDPLTYAAVPLVLLAAVVTASYLPARRAASIDPVDALRR